MKRPDKRFPSKEALAEQPADTASLRNLAATLPGQDLPGEATGALGKRAKATQQGRLGIITGRITTSSHELTLKGEVP